MGIGTDSRTLVPTSGMPGAQGRWTRFFSPRLPSEMQWLKSNQVLAAAVLNSFLFGKAAKCARAVAGAVGQVSNLSGQVGNLSHQGVRSSRAVRPGTRPRPGSGPPDR